MKKNFLKFYYLAALLPICTAQADTLPVNFSGFASAGFISGDLNQDMYSGADVINKSSRFGADNTLGLQISAAMNEQVNLTGQLLAKGTVDSYGVDAHWAYIEFHPDTHLSLRAGQLVLPVFMHSDFVEVGYAYPWIRPPMELYSSVPMSSFSGVDLLYTVEFANVNLILQPFVGSLPRQTSMGYQFEADSAYGLDTTLEFENGSLFLGLMNNENSRGTDMRTGDTVTLDALAMNAGAEFEFGNVLLMSEYSFSKLGYSGFPGDFKDVDMRAGYVTLGYHMGKFLPHITYSKADMSKDQVPALQAIMSDAIAQNPTLAAYLQANPALMQSFMTDPATALASLDMNDPSVQQLMASLDPTLLGTLAYSSNLSGILMPPSPWFYKQDSVTVGVRYDILPKTALKLEYQEIKPKSPSWGLFGGDPGNKVQLTSFVVDVTF